MIVKKQNISFPIYVDIGPDQVGLEATFTAKFRDQKSTGAFAVLPGTFVAVPDAPGFYKLNGVTFSTVGVYEVIVSSTEESVEDVPMLIDVVVASTDDIYAEILLVKAAADSIKTQVDVLDETALNEVNGKVTSIQNKLTELQALLTDTDNDAITSLKEFLIDISNATAAGNTVLSVLEGYTDDIEAMLRGDAKLKDGSDNPLFGNTNVDIMNLLRTTSSFLDSAVTSAKTAILNDAQSKYNTIVTKLTAVSTAIQGNADLLNNNTYGLEALKDLLTTINSNTAGGTQSIIDLLESPSVGLEAIKNALTSAIAAVGAKVDAVGVKVDNVGDKIDTLSTTFKATRTVRTFA